MFLIDQLLQFWANAHWLVALSMAFVVNSMVYVCASAVLSSGIDRAVNEYGLGSYIDPSKLKNDQVKLERRYGVTACFIFALGSLLTRELFYQLWPETLLSFIFQFVLFAAFYETYSYFVHRLLHLRPFSKIHFVHHHSVRVTPWSAYSVHPVEAMFIAISAPVFMLIFPLSLGLALTLHVFGMLFTILLHSNFQYTGKNRLLSLVFSYPAYHSSHHSDGNVNFGFVNQLWDSVCNTHATK